MTNKAKNTSPKYKNIEVINIQCNSVKELVKAEAKKTILENLGYALIDSNGILLTYELLKCTFNDHNIFRSLDSLRHCPKCGQNLLKGLTPKHNT